MSSDNTGEASIGIGDMPVDEAERRLSLCPECLQSDGHHDSWCRNIMALRDHVSG